MRILAGGPARETESELFYLHRDGLLRQRQPGQTLVVRHELEPDPGGPKWHPDKIARVAIKRQRMMDLAMGDYDCLFMVDTDVVCGPGVLQRMMEVDADVVYGVFWSRWEGFSTPMPQIWDVNPYGHTEGLRDGIVAHANLLESRFGFEMDGGKVQELEVLGGGACTLIRRKGFESRYFPLLQSLRDSGGMWPGEDRTFCLDLEVSQVKQVAVFGLPIVHLDTSQKQSSEALMEARQMVGL